MEDAQSHLPGTQHGRPKPAQNVRQRGSEVSQPLSATTRRGEWRPPAKHASPPPPALPAPRLLGDIVDEGPAAEAQLIASLGFVVIQSFHSSLRLSGKQEGKGQVVTAAEEEAASLTGSRERLIRRRTLQRPG